MMQKRFIRKFTIALLLASVVIGCESPRNGQIVITPDGKSVGDTKLAGSETAAASELLGKRDYAGAKAHLDRAIAADSYYGPAHNNMGLVEFKLGDLYRAASEYREAIRLMPRQAEPLNNLGLVLEAASRPRDAEDYYARAAALDPQQPEYIGNLAKVRVGLGQRDAMLTQLLYKIIESDPRPEWTAWARRILETQSTFPPTSRPSS